MIALDHAHGFTQILFSDEGEGHTLASHASSPSGPVGVFFRPGREIPVDDMGYVGEIQAASRHIGGDHAFQLTRLETKLQSARHLAQILDNSDLFHFINQANEQYNQARIAFQAGQRLKASNHIKRAYLFLAQFYQRKGYYFTLMNVLELITVWI